MLYDIEGDEEDLEETGLIAYHFIGNKNIVRPANYSNNNPGKGYRIRTCKTNGKKVAVINLIGRVTMNVLSENPFLVAKSLISNLKNSVDIIIIDFHGEATSEKVAYGLYFDGRINVIAGTHTHVQPADEHILPNGTGYITELGMQGAEIKVDGTVLSITSNSMTLVFETGGSDVSIKASVNEVGLTTFQEIKLNLNLKSVATSALSVSGVLQGVFSRSFTYKAK